MRNGSKVVVLPFTLDELTLLHEMMRVSEKEVIWPNEGAKELFVQLKGTVDSYFKLASRNPDKLGQVSMLNLEYQNWMDQFEQLKKDLPVAKLVDDPRQLKIPLDTTIDRAARLAGGLPVGDPQDPEDDDG